jgi:crotonobetainyl-CoA:carnitine CoA-transferase CaiB-like acyl-CoA transferase
MMSATMDLMAQEASYAMNLGVSPVRSRAGIAHVDQPAPYGVYQTADGYVVMSLGDVASVTKVGEALGVLEGLRPYLTERGLRVNRDEVAGAIASGVRVLSSADLTARMAHTGVWVAPIRTLLDALQDPVVVHQHLITHLSSQYGGQYRVIGNPLKLSGTPIDTFRPAPAPGEHSVVVLRELGYTAAEIEGLLAEKAVVQWAGGGER